MKRSHTTQPALQNTWARLPRVVSTEAVPFSEQPSALRPPRAVTMAMDLDDIDMEGVAGGDIDDRRFSIMNYDTGEVEQLDLCDEE